MKEYILVDKNKIVRCIASLECNLHADKLYMDKYYVKCKGTIGDEYNSKTDSWISKPENHTQPSEKQKQGMLINKRKNKIIENQAITELIAEGLLPPDYEPGENDA